MGSVLFRKLLWNNMPSGSAMLHALVRQAPYQCSVPQKSLPASLEHMILPVRKRDIPRFYFNDVDEQVKAYLPPIHLVEAERIWEHPNIAFKKGRVSPSFNARLKLGQLVESGKTTYAYVAEGAQTRVYYDCNETNRSVSIRDGQIRWEKPFHDLDIFYAKGTHRSNMFRNLVIYYMLASGTLSHACGSLSRFNEHLRTLSARFHLKHESLPLCRAANDLNRNNSETKPTASNESISKICKNISLSILHTCSKLETDCAALKSQLQLLEPACAREHEATKLLENMKCSVLYLETNNTKLAAQNNALETDITKLLVRNEKLETGLTKALDRSNTFETVLSEARSRNDELEVHLAEARDRNHILETELAKLLVDDKAEMLSSESEQSPRAEHAVDCKGHDWGTLTLMRLAIVESDW